MKHLQNPHLTFRLVKFDKDITWLEINQKYYK